MVSQLPISDAQAELAQLERSSGRMLRPYIGPFEFQD